MNRLQVEIKEEVQKYNSYLKDLQSYEEGRRKLDEQLIENEMVIKELNILNADDEVLKLVGPVLVKQNLEEARSTVQKRIQYIKGEIERKEKMISETTSKQKSHEDKIRNIENKIQQMRIQATMHS